MKCNPTWIDEYLADRLDGDTTSELELHLEQCPACRQRLCTHAAEETWWNEAHEYLTESPWDPPTGAELAEGTSRAVLERDVVAFLHPTDDPRMLGRLGSYEIVGLIGMGGMGVVLKGFDAALNRYVAIKVLSPHLASSAAARSRFAREAQAAAAVVHEHVVPIHGVAEHRGLPYLVMPYIRGESLQRRLDRSAPLTVVEAVRIARQCAAALAMRAIMAFVVAPATAASIA